MNIIPGEPVPPGFEDEVNRVAEIQKGIDLYKGNALIGLEYTVELCEDDRREPGYFCLLCDKRGDPRTIMQHWTSFNHRMKYLENHFPTAFREFYPVKYKPNSNPIMQNIVQKLAEAIEEHHGRMTVCVCSADDFRRAKVNIYNEVNAKFHFDERNGPNFMNIVDRLLEESGNPKPRSAEQIFTKAPKRILSTNPTKDHSTRDGLDEISSDSDQETLKKLKKIDKIGLRAPSRVHRASPVAEDRQKDKDKMLPTPKQLAMQATHIAQERYKWEKYRCLLEICLKQMVEERKTYEKCPEKHPQYPETWKKFWGRRYKEIQAENKTDPNKYDYKPEWIVFWQKKMSELFDSDIAKKKKEIKIKLGLPEDGEEQVDQLKEKYKVQAGGRQPSGAVQAQNVDPNGSAAKVGHKTTADVIDISDDDSPNCKRRSKSPHRSRTRSFSPRSRRNYTRNRVRSRSRSPSNEFDRYGRHRPHNHSRASGSSGAGGGGGGGAGAGGIVGGGYPSHELDYYGGHKPTSSSSYSRTRYPVNMPHGARPPAHYRVLDPHRYPKYERTPSPHAFSGKEDSNDTPDDDGTLTVVSVLRLLTALEGHLGSMGPKVVDLLGKALALEKVKANSADDLLLNEDHCVFFETIKEKLKGLLIADMIDDPQKIRAIKRAIQNIAAVIHDVTTRGANPGNKDDENNGDADYQTQPGSYTKKLTGNVVSVKDLPFDRQIVATKLAAALVMQGREDVSTDEMDKLIFFFVLMTKLSHSEGKNLHMKDVLGDLDIPTYQPQAAVAPVAAALVAALPGIVDDLLESEVSALVQEVEEEISNDQSDKGSKNDTANVLETLTDSDLQTLLQNFKHLSTEEQHHLIAHLKKLEGADPVRVEKLRKFVNLSDMSEPATASPSASTSRAKQQPESLSRREDNSNASGSSGQRRGVTVTNPNKFSLDDEDEDDDYNFDDVFKAASSNVSRLSESSRDTRPSKSGSSQSAPTKELNAPSALSSSNALTFNPAGLNVSLSDTQNLIANLMGSLQQSNNNANKATAKPTNNQPKPVPPAAPQLNSSGNMPFYQSQQQSQSFGGNTAGGAGAGGGGGGVGGSVIGGGQDDGYMNQMAASQAYYNSMNGYNNAAYPGYQQWGDMSSMQMPNMQQYPMGYGMPTQQQQQAQQQQPHALGFNMYGQGRNS